MRSLMFVQQAPIDNASTRNSQNITSFILSASSKSSVLSSFSFCFTTGITRTTLLDCSSCKSVSCILQTLSATSWQESFPAKILKKFVYYSLCCKWRHCNCNLITRLTCKTCSPRLLNITSTDRGIMPSFPGEPWMVCVLPETEKNCLNDYFMLTQLVTKHADHAQIMNIINIKKNSLPELVTP